MPAQGNGARMSTRWTPPELLVRSHGDRVPGALAGSLLYARPEHAAVRDSIATFVANPVAQAGEGTPSHTPVALEIGFDHGMRILDHARRFPDWRWLGLEIRKARVDAARPHAPPNCLLVRADARTIVASVLPAGSLDLVYLLFPTPTENPRHLLLTPSFVDDLARALAPGGRVHFATDVEGYFDWAQQCFAGWSHDDGPLPYGPVLSRRERVCKRDELPVYRATWKRPVSWDGGGSRPLRNASPGASA